MYDTFLRSWSDWLFDSRVCVEMKKLMLAAMEIQPRIIHQRDQKCTGAQEQFCSYKHKTTFSMLDLPQTLLALNTPEWNEEETFQDALRIINRLTVINDRAERGISPFKK